MFSCSDWICCWRLAINALLVLLEISKEDTWFWESWKAEKKNPDTPIADIKHAHKIKVHPILLNIFPSFFQNNEIKYITEVVAEKVTFLSSKKADE